MLRAFLASFCCGLLLSLAPSCGAGAPCGPATCPGCCDGNDCLEGTGLRECGAGGKACVACAPIEECRQGACQRFAVDYDASFPGDPDGGALNPDAGLFDAGPPGQDAGRDASVPDASVRDAGAIDAGRDAGGLDAGRDAGPADAGRPDAGSDDAGSDDAGSDDAGDGG